MESPGVGGVEEQECLSKNILQIFEKKKSVMHTRRDVSLILMRSTDTKALTGSKLPQRHKICGVRAHYAPRTNNT